MTSTSQISWTGSAVMIGSFLVGVLLALGHHLFFSGLDGTTVASNSFDLWKFGVTQQQVNTSVGTALAFLAEIFFVHATSMAYTQAFWRAAREQTTSVGTLDTTTTVLDRGVALFRVKTWIKYPLLFLLAVSIWLLPIASVVTPATLSVIVAPISPPQTSTINVPQAEFRSLKFTAPGPRNIFMSYNGPSLEVNRVARASALSGSILPIPAPGLNASWEASFVGPYLKCSNVSDSFRRSVQESILVAYSNKTACKYYMNYLSWTANTGSSVGFSPDFKNGDVPPGTYNPTPFWRNSSTLNRGTFGPRHTYTTDVSGALNPDPMEPATIYFAVNQDMFSQTVGMCPGYYEQVVATKYANFWETCPMIQCQLHATTHSARFNYTNGAQSVDVSFPDLDLATPVKPLWSYWFDDRKCAAVNSNVSTEIVKNHWNSPNCTIDPGTLQHLSFQAIMDAFGRVLVGSVHDGPAGGLQETIVQETLVLSTQLLHTEELRFMADNSSWTNFQWYAAQDNYSNPEMDALFDWTTQVTTKPLARALEELFQNITMSMLSSPALQPNVSSSFDIEPVTVTFNDYQTVYHYAPAMLWLAYGLAAGTSLVGVLIGLVCIYINGAFFSLHFSTIFRATRNADVSVDIKDQDSDGKDPLPKYIREAKVGFRREAFTSAREG